MKNPMLLSAVFIAAPLFSSAQSVSIPSNPQAWISFLPVIFFVLIIALTVLKLRKDKVELSDLFSEKDVPVTAQTLVVTPGAAGATTTVSPVEPPQSVSRFVAFVSGITTISLAVSISTFFMYEYFSGDKAIDLSKLSTVLYGLGIGILPYGFNKISAALK